MYKCKTNCQAVLTKASLSGYHKFLAVEIDRNDRTSVEASVVLGSKRVNGGEVSASGRVEK